MTLVPQAVLFESPPQVGASLEDKGVKRNRFGEQRVGHRFPRVRHFVGVEVNVE